MAKTRSTACISFWRRDSKTSLFFPVDMRHRKPPRGDFRPEPLLENFDESQTDLVDRDAGRARCQDLIRVLSGTRTKLDDIDPCRGVVRSRRCERRCPRAARRRPTRHPAKPNRPELPLAAPERRCARSRQKRLPYHGVPARQLSLCSSCANRSPFRHSNPSGSRTCSHALRAFSKKANGKMVADGIAMIIKGEVLRDDRHAADYRDFRSLTTVATRFHPRRRNQPRRTRQLYSR